MKKLLVLALTVFPLMFFSTQVVQAVIAQPGGVSGGLQDSSETDEIFGTINPPAGVEKYDAAAGSDQIGLILFLSNIIKIGTIVAGVWVMVNFILAGWTYITATGDAKSHTEASQKMTYSLVGIALIVGAYTLAAVIGLVVFGDATYILNPRFTGVGGGL